MQLSRLGAGLAVPGQRGRSSPNIGSSRPVGGGPVQRFTRKGETAPRCPSGARSVGSGKYGTGLDRTSWRDCEMPAPKAAPPPPPPPAPVITVSPAIQTQVSPQISPVMTQMQASPGASVQAQPISTPGGQQAATAPQQDIERILAAERRAMAAEAEREQAARQAEMQELQRQYAQREALQAEMAARQAAETEARRLSEEAAAAEAPPPPMVMTAGAPSPLMPPIMAPEIQPAMMPPEGAPEPRGNMLPILIAAALGVGLLVMGKGKKRAKR